MNNDNRNYNLDYIAKADATHIRIYPGYDGYEIDAADDNGNYIEECWTIYDGEPVSKEKAFSVAREFALYIGRPSLAFDVREVPNDIVFGG